MRRLSTAGHNHACPVPRLARLTLHGGRQVHRKCNRAEHTVRMVHEPNELAEVSLPNKIEHTTETWMPVVQFTTLDEQNLSLKWSTTACAYAGFHHFAV